MPPAYDFPLPSEPSELTCHSTSLEFEPSAEQIDPAVKFEHIELNQHMTDLDIVHDEQTTGLESTGGFFEPAETVMGVDQSAELTDLSDPATEDIERCAEQVVAQSVAAALQEVRSTSSGRCCTYTHMLQCHWSTLFTLLMCC